MSINARRFSNALDDAWCSIARRHHGVEEHFFAGARVRLGKNNANAVRGRHGGGEEMEGWCADQMPFIVVGERIDEFCVHIQSMNK